MLRLCALGVLSGGLIWLGGPGLLLGGLVAGLTIALLQPAQ